MSIWLYHLILAGSLLRLTTSSWESVPPEQSIAPMIAPWSISGMPPRDAMVPSNANVPPEGYSYQSRTVGFEQLDDGIACIFVQAVLEDRIITSSRSRPECDNRPRLDP